MQKRIIERERARLADRLRGHVDNDVWEKRDAPPDNWNEPLPDNLAEAAEDSYLRLIFNLISDQLSWSI